MPRKARVQTFIGVYHAILRGVNKQQICKYPKYKVLEL